MNEGWEEKVRQYPECDELGEVSVSYVPWQWDDGTWDIIATYLQWDDGSFDIMKMYMDQGFPPETEGNGYATEVLAWKHCAKTKFFSYRLWNHLRSKDADGHPPG